MPDLNLIAKILAQKSAPYAKTAFDIAVENGFRGSAADWLKSLHGSKGDKGDPGEAVHGKDGVTGQRGPRGPEGPIGPMPAHRWEGTKLQFQQGPGGEWGKAVDLKGDKGPQQFVGGGPITLPAAASANSWFPSGW